MRSTLFGLEYHRSEEQLDQLVSGHGPKRMVWDVRVGAEMPLNAAVTTRAGYIYRNDEQDEFTPNNEYLSNAVTLGLGLRPPGASWILETGFIYEWLRGDFGDPGQPRGDRHQVAAQLRWDM